jgi:hypothetical protein
MSGQAAASSEFPAASPRPPADPNPQLPPDLTREAERFHRWLDGKLTELRQAELSYLEPVLPAMAVRWLESCRWAHRDPHD